MYQIRIEHQCASRWYKSDSQVDAFELFDLLTKTCSFVQVWDGEFLICEYNNK